MISPAKGFGRANYSAFAIMSNDGTGFRQIVQEIVRTLLRMKEGGRICTPSPPRKVGTGVLSAVARQGGKEFEMALKALSESISVDEPGGVLSPIQGEIPGFRGHHL